MVNAMVPLQNITLGSAQSSVTFASIPSTGYRDLRLVAVARSTYSAGSGDAIQMRVNGDTGSNYSEVAMDYTGSAVASYSGTGTSIRIARINNSFGGNTVAGMFSVDFFDSSATNKHKPILSRDAMTKDTDSIVVASRWASTSAISGFVIYPVQSGSQFAAGSTFALYGVVS